jgi:hypothetical protein
MLTLDLEGHTYVGVGGQTATVQANDGLGNVAVTYTFQQQNQQVDLTHNDKIFLEHRIC